MLLFSLYSSENRYEISLKFAAPAATPFFFFLTEKLLGNRHIRTLRVVNLDVLTES